MPLYVADYLADTGHLGAAEHGAYMLLIMQYWQKGGLPDDDRQLARIARMTDRAWGAAKPILRAFFADGWRHTRIEVELAKATEKNERRVAAGKAGGFKKHKGSKRGSNATGNDTSNALAFSSQPELEDTSLRSVSARAARKPKSVRTRIADDAQPELADRDHAVKIGMASDVFRFEWARFRDHHLKTGSSFASWPAAWRTWCANWIERGGNRTRAGPAPRSQDGLVSALHKISGLRHDLANRSHHPTGTPESSDPGDAHARQPDHERGRDQWAGPQLDLVAAGADRR